MTGNEARAIRDDLGLSTIELALLVGTDARTIRRWEARKGDVPPDRVLKLLGRMHDKAARDEFTELGRELKSALVHGGLYALHLLLARAYDKVAAGERAT